ncbi:hypothetical protein ACFQKF_22040 [Halalkalicoccus sp. GCM10025322]
MPDKAVANTIVRPTRLIFVFVIIGLIFGSLVAFTETFISGVPTLIKGQVSSTGERNRATSLIALGAHGGDVWRWC